MKAACAAMAGQSEPERQRQSVNTAPMQAMKTIARAEDKMRR